MGDLNDLQAAATSKLVGSSPTGTEQVPVGSVTDDEGNGRLLADVRLRSGELVPTITNKLRIRTNSGVSVNLPGDMSWVTLYTRLGEGLFFGFQAGFNSDKVDVKLIIDGGTVFDLSLGEIRTFQFNDTTTTRCQAGSFLTTIGNVFDFSSRFPIPYDTDLTIQARSNTGSARVCSTWMSIHTED